MSYARTRKHYRVAKKLKEEETKSLSGIFIPYNKRNKLIAMSIIITLIVFLKGFILGWAITTDN